MGLRMRGAATVVASQATLKSALADASPYVRIAAAEALGQFGASADLATALPVLLAHADWSKHDLFTSLAALHALESLGTAKIIAVRAAILALPATGPSPDPRYAPYIPRILEDLRTALGAPAAESAPKRGKKKAAKE